jgi:hypothetical protein
MPGALAYRPTGHWVHDPAPSSAKCPGGHGRLGEPPAGQNDPGGHRTHCAEPGVCVYHPAGHAVHTVAATVLKELIPHAAHSTAPAAL